MMSALPGEIRDWQQVVFRHLLSKMWEVDAGSGGEFYSTVLSVPQWLESV